MEMLSISNHLRSLVQVVQAIMEYSANYSNNYWEDEYLEILNSMKLIEYAGNITETKYSPFTDSGMFCKGVHKEELSEHKNIEPYLFNLSIFSITWMGLESMINDMGIYNDKKGKINALCNKLNEYSSKIKVPREYKKCLSSWKDIEKQLNNQYKSRKHIPDNININGEGIYRVYSLRNHLIHGNFSSLLPSDPLWKIYIEFLSLGTRIIAFTIQMLLMAHYSDEKYATTFWHGSLSEYGEFVCTKRAFKFLHLTWI